jgi:hypothetical protein
VNTIKQGDMPTREMNVKAKESVGSGGESASLAGMATQAMEPEMIAYLRERRSGVAAPEAPKLGEMPKSDMNVGSLEYKSAAREVGKQGEMPTRGMN